MVQSGVGTAAVQLARAIGARPLGTSRTAAKLPRLVELGLAPDDVVYVCCQSLFKYLPRWDWVFPAIAMRVPKARFLFIRDGREAVTFLVRVKECLEDPQRFVLEL